MQLVTGDMMAKGFEREVLVRLEYIKENQQKHDKIFKDVYERINKHSNEINEARGYIKGAYAIGGVSIFLNFIKRLFGG
jgi:hypothetical protein